MLASLTFLFFFFFTVAIPKDKTNSFLTVSVSSIYRGICLARNGYSSSPSLQIATRRAMTSSSTCRLHTANPLINLNTGYNELMLIWCRLLPANNTIKRSDKSPGAKGANYQPFAEFNYMCNGANADIETWIQICTDPRFILLS